MYYNTVAARIERTWQCDSEPTLFMCRVFKIQSILTYGTGDSNDKPRFLSCRVSGFNSAGFHHQDCNILKQEGGRCAGQAFLKTNKFRNFQPQWLQFWVIWERKHFADDHPKGIRHTAADVDVRFWILCWRTGGCDRSPSTISVRPNVVALKWGKHYRSWVCVLHMWVLAEGTWPSRYTSLAFFFF